MWLAAKDQRATECKLHTQPAFNSFKTNSAETFYSVVFPHTLKVSVAYTLTAAPSTDGQTRLPFYRSHTHG